MRWLRKDGVPVWEVAAQLGHSIARHEMTERYAAFSPDYLEKSATSLDRLLREVRDNCVTLSKPRFEVEMPKPLIEGEEKWWSMQGSNLRPLQCQSVLWRFARVCARLLNFEILQLKQDTVEFSGLLKLDRVCAELSERW